MKIKSKFTLNLKTREAISAVERAGQLGLRDTVVDIARDAVAGSPVLTGHNRRSIDYTVRGLGAEIFSASGYGGYLEVGTHKMPARPYFKPAYDRHIKELAGNMKRHFK